MQSPLDAIANLMPHRTNLLDKDNEIIHSWPVHPHIPTVRCLESTEIICKGSIAKGAVPTIAPLSFGAPDWPSEELLAKHGITAIIVSRECAQRLHPPQERLYDKIRVLSPGPLIREEGKILGCRSLCDWEHARPSDFFV